MCCRRRCLPTACLLHSAFCTLSALLADCLLCCLLLATLPACPIRVPLKLALCSCAFVCLSVRLCVSSSVNLSLDASVCLCVFSFVCLCVCVVSSSSSPSSFLLPLPLLRRFTHRFLRSQTAHLSTGSTSRPLGFCIQNLVDSKSLFSGQQQQQSHTTFEEFWAVCCRTAGIRS